MRDRQHASNLDDLIDTAVLKPLKNGIRQIDVAPPLPTFPWGATLWAVQMVKRYAGHGRGWNEFTAEELLLYLRALRTASWLSCELTTLSSFAMVAGEVAYSLDALQGCYDSKAALATFVLLNLTDEQAQLEVVQWAARCAAFHCCLHTSEVELTLRRLYVHYYGKDASGSCWLKDKVMAQRGRRISGAKHVFISLWPSFADVEMLSSGAPEFSEPSPIDQFRRMTWAIDDAYPDYRHPTIDSSAWPGTMGVVSFESLMKAVRSGCVGEVLSHYQLCTSEPTFERLLNAFSELSAHVRNRITYISANDAHILGELKKLLLNSVAGEAPSFVTNKLTVLPIQRNYPLCNCEVINLPFENISLNPAFEESARRKHAELVDAYAEVKEYTDSRSLWGLETIYADLILAMTLRTKMFANSTTEAEVANTHGIGVSALSMRTKFHE